MTLVSDGTLSVIKYSSSILAALYGVYATVTDFHEKRGGKRRLSRKGFAGIALLIVASTATLTSDYFKDQNDKQKAAEELEDRKQLLKGEQETSASLKESLTKLGTVATGITKTQKDLKGTSDVLKETSKNTLAAFDEAKRINDPIRPLSAVAILSMPDNAAALQPYIERLRKEHTSGGLYWARVTTGEDGHPDFPTNVPGESLPFALGWTTSVMIKILPAHDATNFLVDTLFRGDCYVAPNVDASKKGMVIGYDGRDKHSVTVRCTTKVMERSEDTGKITSHLDLPGRNMEVTFFSVVTQYQDIISSSMNTPTSLTVVFSEEGGRRWVVKGFRRTGVLTFVKALTSGDIEAKNIFNRGDDPF